MASVSFSQCRTRSFERGPLLTRSPTSTQFQALPVVDLTKDHPVARRSLGLDPSRHFRKAAGAVPFSCSARRNCFLSNVQTVPPPRTTSITDTTENPVQLVGMSLSSLTSSKKWWTETHCRLCVWKSKHEFWIGQEYKYHHRPFNVRVEEGRICLNDKE